jgi:hypothetical protein
MDARSLDVLADDLPPHHMLGDDMHDTLSIHPIIQSGRAARTGQRGKPATERWHHIAGEDFSHQDVGTLRAASEAALPHELGVRRRTLCGERQSKLVMKHGRSVTVTALRTTADDDLEAA